MMDTGIGWFNRDKVFKSRPPPIPIRLLDEKNGTIAGIKIDSFHQPIRNERRVEVADALRKLNFHVKFERPLTGSQWEIGTSSERADRGCDGEPAQLTHFLLVQFQIGKPRGSRIKS